MDARTTGTPAGCRAGFARRAGTAADSARSPQAARAGRRRQRRQRRLSAPTRVPRLPRPPQARIRGSHCRCEARPGRDGRGSLTRVSWRRARQQAGVTTRWAQWVRRRRAAGGRPPRRAIRAAAAARGAGRREASRPTPYARTCAGGGDGWTPGRPCRGHGSHGGFSPPRLVMALPRRRSQGDALALIGWAR